MGGPFCGRRRQPLVPKSLETEGGGAWEQICLPPQWLPLIPHCQVFFAFAPNVLTSFFFLSLRLSFFPFKRHRLSQPSLHERSLTDRSHAESTQPSFISQVHSKIQFKTYD